MAEGPPSLSLSLHLKKFIVICSVSITSPGILTSPVESCNNSYLALVGTIKEGSGSITDYRGEYSWLCEAGFLARLLT